MKKLISIIFLTLFAQFTIAQCGGTSRWDVKTLTDTLSNKVDTTPKKATIKELSKLKKPLLMTRNSKRQSAEFHTYTVKCFIREYKMEDDNDYHLVLVDAKDTSKTMIGEIPDASCDVAKRSKYAKNFADTGKEFEKHIKKGGKVAWGVYEITGVLFFDLEHAKNPVGNAPNNLEFHPIISFKKL